MSKKFSNDWAKNRTVNQVMDEFSKSNLYCAMKYEFGYWLHPSIFDFVIEDMSDMSDAVDAMDGDTFAVCHLINRYGFGIFQVKNGTPSQELCKRIRAASTENVVKKHLKSKIKKKAKSA